MEQIDYVQLSTMVRAKEIDVDFARLEHPTITRRGYNNLLEDLASFERGWSRTETGTMPKSHYLRQSSLQAQFNPADFPRFYFPASYTSRGDEQ
jgi:hypothetical protein